MRTGLKLKTIELSLNNFCTLNCIGCPSLNPDNSQKKQMEIESFIEKFKNIEIYEIVLCGNSGEPLEHENIKGILEKISASFPQTKIQVSTNGEKVVELFKNEDENSVFNKVLFQVALDGHTKEIHSLTRRNSNFNSVINSLEFLMNKNWNFEVISSRHKLNEIYSKEIAQFVLVKFKKDVIFRDTTISKEKIESPVRKSKNGDVSFLFNESFNSFNYVPDFEKLYVNYNGDVFPCVSFVKIPSQGKAPNIHTAQTWLEFYKEYNEFKVSFCHCYQKSGDKKQCQLNCGLYRTFKYDTISDLK